MKKNEVARKLALVLVMICVMMIFTGCEPRQEKIVVSKTSWEYVIKIQKQVLCQESAWSLPENATLLEEKQEVYKKIYDDEGNVTDYEYRTKYYYEIMRWRYERSVVTQGTGFIEYFGEYTLAEDERVSSKEKNYYVHGKNENGKSVSYQLKKSDWSKIDKGDTLELEISFWGVVEIKSQQKAKK